MARNGLDGLVLHPECFEKSPTPTLISMETKPALLPPAVNKDVSLPHPLVFLTLTILTGMRKNLRAVLCFLYG